MSNPYRAIVAKTGEPVTTDFRLRGQSSPFMDKTGEINASSVGDLLGQIGHLIKAHNSGDIRNVPKNNPQIIRNRREVLLEAINDQSGTAMRMLGQAMAVEIQDTTSREGFARRLLQFNELGQGEVNEVRVRQHDVTAYTAVSSTEVTPTIVRGRKMIPPEFNIEAYILIDLKELSTTPGDLLEEKYEEGLEATMVAEDKLWKQLSDSVSTLRNTQQLFTTFTPQIFSRIKSQVSRWGIPTPHCLIAYDIWDDIIGNSDFSGLFDPVTKYELVNEGTLGTILGITMITDAFRQENLKVLDVGEVFVVGAPVNHGVISVRGSMLVEPINRFAEGKSLKGWFINQITSMSVANATSVAKGQRI